MLPKSAEDRLAKAKAKKEEMEHDLEEAQREADQEEAGRNCKECGEAKQQEGAVQQWRKHEVEATKVKEWAEEETLQEE